MENRLWYHKPAKEWEEALPIGNGRLGAMLYGGTDRELIQVNEESMWYGGAVNRINPDFSAHLPQIRECLKNGKIKQAEKLMELAMSGCPQGMHCYQTLGEIQLYFEDMEYARTRKSGKVGETTLCEGMTSYERSLSLEEAVVKTRFQSGNTLYERSCFASKPADCIIMKLSAKGEKRISFYARLGRGKFFDGVKKAGQNGICLYGNLGRGGYEYAMVLKAKAVDGTVRVIGESLQVKDAREVILYFTADTTYHYGKEETDTYVTKYLKNPPKIEEGLTEELSAYEEKEYHYQKALQSMLLEKIEERLEKAFAKSYESLLEEHLADYQKLYQCFALDFDTKDMTLVSTDERLEALREGKEDLGLVSLLLSYGRYLTIACSREGGLPSTLQGLWNNSFTPPWDSKYTININTEMNYWHVESCHLSSCHKPLFTLIEKMKRHGRIVAKEMYGCRGFVAHHNTDIHGDCAPQDIWYPGTYWTLGAAWLCTHLWTHYAYTKDLIFLEQAFPTMVEAALFFVDFLVEQDGYLVLNPSVSPENSYLLPNGEMGSCCIGATMDAQILRALFTDCERAWEALGKKVPKDCQIEGVSDMVGLMAQISDCKKRLVPTRIGPKGTILEWLEDYEEVEPGHRHISHLFGLFPGEEISMDKTPELAAAAAKTLERRLQNGGGHTGWSRAWITNHYASLWDGEKAYESIKKMLESSTYPNLFDKHPPFQIDGNFGICAAIVQMLVQSNMQEIRLLPALPKAWKKGSIRGVCVQGNAELSLSWEENRLTECVIKAHSAYEGKLIYGDKLEEVSLQAGEEKRVSLK